MTTRVTSTQLAAVASSLRTLRDALLAHAEDFGRVVSAGRDAGDLLPRCWGGALPERVNGHLSSYVTAIEGTSGAAESARGTVDRWATRADGLSEALASAEAWRDATTGLLDDQRARAAADLPVASGAYSALLDDERRATSRLSELSQEWATACTNFADELQSAITTMSECASAAVGTPELRQAVSGQSYFTAIALFALEQAMPFDVIDPTGGLQAVADAQLDAFTEGEYAGLKYAVVETMHAGDIRLLDGDTSREDWMDATDFTAVRYRVEMAAELAGLSLDDATLDAIALDIVTSAVFTVASDGDCWEEVDGQMEADPAIHAALEEEAVQQYIHHGASEQPPDEWITEVDFVLPAEPTETDYYIEAWIAARHAPETDVGWTVITTAWSFFVPDLATINPMSDEFSPFWAGVEIIGIGNPIDEAAGVVRVGARILDSFSDAANVSEDLGDLGKVLDADTLMDGVSGTAAAGDNVLRSGDELLEGSDDVAGEPPGGGGGRDPDDEPSGGGGDPDDEPGGGDGDPDDEPGGGDGDPGDGDDPDQGSDGSADEPPPNSGPGPYVENPLEHMPEELRHLSEQHQTGSGETVIGPFRPPEGPSYIEVANENGASYFDIGKRWDDFTPEARDAANQHVLDLAIENGDTVRLSYDPSELPPDGYTWWEIT